MRRMNYATRHRGPDGSVVLSDTGVTMGHNRLAIIDLSLASSQPMKSPDGRFMLTYNGELYNFRELKEEIGDRYQFKTEGDTEVVLAAYMVWGHECVLKFNGMFAFAVWDRDREELFLARDHAGIKPLYYFWDGEQFIFSSEVKGILEGGVDRAIDMEAASMYFRLSYVPEPYTMFAQIKSLPAGSLATLSKGLFSIERYFSLLDAPEETLLARDAAKELDELLDRAVSRQLVSDRPVGVFLSGGLDSSAVLSAAAKVHPGIDTFTVRFSLPESNEEEKFNEDAELAREVAAQFGAHHHEITITPEEVPALLLKAAFHMDVPVSNPTIPSMLRLSEETAKTATVVLNGDGGDELFGGYTRYRFSKRVLLYQKWVPAIARTLLAKVRPIFAKANLPPGIGLFAQFMFQKDATLASVLSPELVTNNAFDRYRDRYFSERGDFLRQFMSADREGWLVDEALMRTDRTTMAAALEARVPLLDRELLAFAARVPTKLKTSLRVTKILPRIAFRNRLSKNILIQKKRGWVSPGAKWLRHPDVLALATEAFSKGYHPETDALFNLPALKNALADHVSGKQYNLYLLWSVLTFRLWAKTWQANAIVE